MRKAQDPRAEWPNNMSDAEFAARYGEMKFNMTALAMIASEMIQPRPAEEMEVQASPKDGDKQ